MKMKKRLENKTFIISVNFSYHVPSALITTNLLIILQLMPEETNKTRSTIELKSDKLKGFIKDYFETPVSDVAAALPHTSTDSSSSQRYDFFAKICELGSLAVSLYQYLQRNLQ